MKVKQISQDEARVLCLFAQKLKYFSSSFKRPSLKEKPTKATNDTYLPKPKWDSTKISIIFSLGTHVTKPHAESQISHSLASLWETCRGNNSFSTEACCSEFQLHQGNGINHPPPGSIQKQEGNNWCENHLPFSYTFEMWRGSYAQGHLRCDRVPKSLRRGCPNALSNATHQLSSKSAINSHPL